MDIIISNSDKTPIYEQIARQVKDMIMDGTLKEGDALPSMRYLAKELRISMITTKRAYEDLERDGFIESYVGKGCFVKGANQDFIREQNRKEMETYLGLACQKAKLSGVTQAEMAELLSVFFEDC